MNIFTHINLENNGITSGWHEVLEIAIVPLAPDLPINTNLMKLSCQNRANPLEHVEMAEVATKHLDLARESL